MPRVTIIVPTYNFGHYLGQTIRSVLGQTCGDFELLVFDNVSTDNTPEIVRGFSDPRLRYRRQERNLGLYGNAGSAIREARGDYVVIVGADDILEPGFVEQATKMADAHPRMSLLHGAAVWIDEHGTAFGGTNDRWPVLSSGEDAIPYIFRYGFCLTTMFMRTRLVQPLMPFDPHWGDMADAWIFLRLCLAGDIGYLHQPLVRYRVHQKSLSLTMYATGEFFSRHLGLVREAFAWPEMKERGLQRYGSGAVCSVARESIRILHSTRLASTRARYCRTFFDVVRAAPAVLWYPETWARFAFGMLPRSLILRLRAWNRARWMRRSQLARIQQEAAT